MPAAQPKAKIYPGLAAEGGPDDQAPRPRRARRSPVVRALAIAVVMVLPGVAYVSQRTQAAKTGYEILQLRHEVGALQSENARLLATATALKSLDRIERIATKNLGMGRPRQPQLATITVAPMVASSAHAMQARSVWDRLAAWLGRSEAEAHEPR